MNDKIGDYRLFHDSCRGFYVAKLCPMNTSDPRPDNAFWQQVTKCYHYRKYCDKFIREHKKVLVNKV